MLLTYMHDAEKSIAELPVATFFLMIQENGKTQYLEGGLRISENHKYVVFPEKICRRTSIEHIPIWQIK